MTAELSVGATHAVSAQAILAKAQQLAKEHRVELSQPLMECFTGHFDGNEGFMRALGRTCHPASGKAGTAVADFRWYVQLAYDRMM